MISRLLLTASLPFLLADAPPPQLRQWTLELEQASSVELDLVRGRAEIVRRPGPVHIEVRPRRGSSFDGVDFDVERSGRAIRITDSYAIHIGRIAEPECEPPIGKRGPYWRSAMAFDVKIVVPSEIGVEVRILDQLAKAD